MAWLTLLRISRDLSKHLRTNVISSLRGCVYLARLSNNSGYLVNRCMAVGIISFNWSRRQTGLPSASAKNAYLEKEREKELVIVIQMTARLLLI